MYVCTCVNVCTTLGVHVCLYCLSDGFGLEPRDLWPCGGGVCGQTAASVALYCSVVVLKSVLKTLFSRSGSCLGLGPQDQPRPQFVL